MSFILVIYAIILITLTMLKYRSIFPVIVVIFCVFASTTSLLVCGLGVFQTQETWHVFGKDIIRSTFLHLIIVLLIFNIIVSVLIIRNYIQYIRVNRN